MSDVAPFGYKTPSEMTDDDRKVLSRFDELSRKMQTNGKSLVTGQNGIRTEQEYGVLSRQLEKRGLRPRLKLKYRR